MKIVEFVQTRLSNILFFGLVLPAGLILMLLGEVRLGMFVLFAGAVVLVALSILVLVVGPPLPWHAELQRRFPMRAALVRVVSHVAVASAVTSWFLAPDNAHNITFVAMLIAAAVEFAIIRLSRSPSPPSDE